jgi:Tol biopolymer transport system component
VIYSRSTDDKVTLWKAPLEGGAPVQLAEQNIRVSALSPDGKLIAYFERDEQRRGIIVVMPFEGGPAIKTFELPPTTNLQAGLRWTPDGRAVTYVNTRGGVSNIWGQPLSGGAPKQLTDFKTEQIRAFAWSRDGQLAVSRGVVNSDVVLISGFR